MGLFRKKKSNLEFTEYSNPDKSKGLLTAFDRMEYFVIQEDFENDMFKVSDTILKQKAVLANFDKVKDVDCNYMLAFISGVVYSLGGEVITLGERLFLFAGKSEFEDGSLHQYVEDIKWTQFI